jgi:integration host factor subunit alpha
MVRKVIKRKNFKKKDIIKSIFLSTGIPYAYSTKIVNNIIKILILDLKKNKKVKIKNFGNFKVQNKKKRIGRNPKNNQTHEISKRTIISFNSSESLKKRINNYVKK